ncbi:PAAR-like domain-containing protein [Caballeronia sp. LZ034LL]|uniref:PAAR-like domain-containing protein n=1 Tax=Caballeronia sp. LZ034LL TaxID=3038567 RepID=UPI0028587192|nr:PAAR-like domain-containing protein [Caballeronia sp. LZ034LL]MDR5836406.1 DUF4150 domain-containing protein [Caballeronia sp. LZ034LL]
MVMVNSSAGGGNDAVSVNKTPPVGTPAGYDNNSQRGSAQPNVTNVMVGGGFAHNMGTTIPASNGDQGGAQGGVASGSVSASSRNSRGANTVLLQGMPTTRMTDPTLQNNANTTGTGSSPSQTKVLNMAS